MFFIEFFQDFPLYSASSQFLLLAAKMQSTRKCRASPFTKFIKSLDSPMHMLVHCLLSDSTYRHWYGADIFICFFFVTLFLILFDSLTLIARAALTSVAAILVPARAPIMTRDRKWRTLVHVFAAVPAAHARGTVAEITVDERKW